VFGRLQVITEVSLRHATRTLHLLISLDPIGGKSAVLTGIAVALGGKATSTGRGSGLKSFVKEGEKCVFWGLIPQRIAYHKFCSAAEVTIRLKNEGSEAYKPDVYGKSIIITRNFNISGSSGYKIKALVDGKKNQEKLVSTKREELNAICDHMSIQVRGSITDLPASP
jgi:structural maintenance of chromosomes protein 6